ncbi:PilZ domain-containing protein [Halalkalibacter hemicellulosilyticus]|uniref:PilZ domain-containing protein n=1 Tax=Halalkalibacter hemicellulosilyticusJCM 9152 TaxID=1236971 RepID=W4QKA7_9BACI|nr:PilZ domain-containing protein [Halalkalibacter hemicellulosilyticus]GAE32545.1 hypothetical protein JCM9152_4082 [Halalkalibacter hemicellulosilyticusJCM 9152]
MRYKRDESFRYEFKQPLDGTFTILTEGETSKPASIHILDVSPGGIKFTTKLDLPIEEKGYRLKVEMVLSDEQIEIVGTIVWKKPSHGQFVYGFEAEEDEELEKYLIHLLKRYIKTIEE